MAFIWKLGSASKWQAGSGSASKWYAGSNNYRLYSFQNINSVIFTTKINNTIPITSTSVADPESDPYVFGPPGSFYHQAKIVKQNLDSYCFGTSMKNDFYVPSKRNKQTWRSCRSMTKIAGSGSRIQDPDTLVRGMDPRIRICTKMSWIRNTGFNKNTILVYYFSHLG